jgi:hypothetical protein
LRQQAYDIAMDGDRDAVLLKSRTPSGGTITKQSGGCAGQAERDVVRRSGGMVPRRRDRP